MDVSDPNTLSLTTTGFAELMLQLPLYEWQGRALLPLEKATGVGGKRQNIAVVTPNGSGKDERLIPSAAYWWLFYHPRGRVVITSKSGMQLEEQTIPQLDKHWMKFGWPEPVKSPRYRMTTTTGGSLIAYVTNDGARAEGHHSRPGEPLLMIVNEAKSVDADIWRGIDRCTPDVLMLVSSPGMREGRFFECFEKNSHLYHTVRAGLKDCPHIPQEKIDQLLAEYGENDPTTRSSLFGEFMASMDGDQYCVTTEELERCYDNPPPHRPGFKFGFFDFADGRAENVLCLRNGNKYEIADAWISTDEDAVIGRCLYLITQNNLKDGQWGGDAAAKSILDKLASAGRHGIRRNFGAKDPSGIYKSWSAKAWLDGAQKIRNREVILPEDRMTRSQIGSRKKVFAEDGKLAVEAKYKMFQERGIRSPDRADALFGAMAQVDTSLMVNVIPFDFSDFNINDSRDSISQCVGL